MMKDEPNPHSHSEKKNVFFVVQLKTQNEWRTPRARKKKIKTRTRQKRVQFSKQTASLCVCVMTYWFPARKTWSRKKTDLWKREKKTNP